MSGTSTKDLLPPAKKHRVEAIFESHNWDERLEAARAQREKILAQKCQERNDDPEQAPTVSPDSVLRAPSPDSVPGRRKQAPVLVAPVRSVTSDTVERTRPDRAQSDLWRGSASPIMVTTACAAALGFGLSFGFGAVLMWNSGAKSPAPAPLVAVAPTPQSALPAERAGEPAVAATRPVGTTSTAPTPAIHVYAPGSVTPEALDRSTAALGRSGAEVADIQRLNMNISAPHVRFYNASDAATALGIAADMQVEARDFSKSGNGAPGRIELWLDGTSDHVARRSQDPVEAVLRFGRQLIDQLQ